MRGYLVYLAPQIEELSPRARAIMSALQERRLLRSWPRIAAPGLEIFSNTGRSLNRLKTSWKSIS
jgi:hypothetical protein